MNRSVALFTRISRPTCRIIPVSHRRHYTAIPGSEPGALQGNATEDITEVDDDEVYNDEIEEALTPGPYFEDPGSLRPSQLHTLYKSMNLPRKKVMELLKGEATRAYVEVNNDVKPPPPMEQQEGGESGKMLAPELENDELGPDELDEMLDDVTHEDDDTTTMGHRMFGELRQNLYYMRVIEHEMPRLVAFRKQFHAPPPSDALIVRSIDYAGEQHPATVKRCIVASVDKLPLRDAEAIRKVKILAGPRWTQRPPANSGVSKAQTWGNGFIKIACEDFASSAMNLKWASDTLDKLIAEANNLNSDRYSDVPVDLRHIYSKARREKKGEHVRGRVGNRASIYDYPPEWLPHYLQ